METVTEKIERFKATAEIFLLENKKTYIQDSEGNLYFCYILLVGENSLRIECFAPKQRQGEKFTLYYPLILKLDEYKEKRS